MPQAYKYETAPFFSIKPKLDILRLFVDFCFYLNLPDLILKFSVLMFITILGSDQVNSSRNTKTKKQSHVKFLFDKKKMLSCLIFIYVAVKSSG